MTVSADSKIFGIGLSKTGTTSLHYALRILGFRSIHNSAILEPVIDCNRHAGRRLLWGLSDSFDAFCDYPICHSFRELDVQYPGSRFIVTVRELRPWLISKADHIQRFVPEADRWKHGTPKDWTQWYNEHQALVEEYFQGRDDILTLRVCNGAGWLLLCNFLGVQDVPTMDFPHAMNLRSKGD